MVHVSVAKLATNVLVAALGAMPVMASEVSWSEYPQTSNVKPGGADTSPAVLGVLGNTGVHYG